MAGAGRQEAPKGRVRALILALVIVAAAGAAVFAGARTGWLGRAWGAYDEWSLRQRVDSLWQARVERDIPKAEKFVGQFESPRAALGRAVKYESYSIQGMQVEGDRATVKMAIEYRVDLPGFTASDLPPEKAELTQNWVKQKGEWFWDPGPLPPSARPVELDPGDGTWKDVTGEVAPPKAAPDEPKK
jgi:hypothetical protein